MKQIKITIKCEALTVRTKDLSIGLSILNHLTNHGITKYSIVSNIFLEKIKNVLQEIKDSLLKIGKNLYKTSVNKDITENVYPKFTRKSIIPRESSVINIKKVSQPEDAIDKAILEDILQSNSNKAHEETLDKKDKIQSDIMNVNKDLDKVIDNERTKDITNRTNVKYITWTKEEIDMLKNNLHITDEALLKLIPNRTLEAIRFKRRVVTGRTNRSKKSKQNRWTKKELKALSSNPWMRPRYLIELSELKNKSIKQINQKKHVLKYNALKEFHEN